MSQRVQFLYLIDRFPSPLEVALAPSLPALIDPGMFTIWTAVLDGGKEKDRTAPTDGLVHKVHAGVLLGRLDPRPRLAVRRLLRHLRPDIVCAFGWRARLLGLPVARALGIPARVAMVNDMGGELTPGRLHALRMSNRAATRFLVDSYAVARRLMRQEAIPRDRIDIIPPGVDAGMPGSHSPEATIEAKHRLGLSRQEPVVLTTASARRSGDQTRFLHAVTQLAPLAKSARFVILSGSDTPGQESIGREVGRLHLTQRVLVSNRAEDVGLWLAAADVAVVTEHEEGCAPALLAFMAAGLPIVAVNVGGNSEMIVHGETGYLADLGDPDQLAMFIMVLLLSPEQRERLGARAQECVRAAYSRTDVGVRYTDYFRTLAYATRAA